MKRRGQRKKKAAGALLAAGGMILIVKAVPLSVWYGLLFLCLLLTVFFLLVR